jgi:acetyl esterase/lipase
MSGFRFSIAGAAFLLLNSCLGIGGAGFGAKQVVFTPSDWPDEVRGTVFRPESEKPAPAVLLLHGGVKLGDDGRWVMNGIARKLAARGYYVLNITYRNMDDWPYPAQLEDVRQALDWMKRNANQEGIDAQRIAVFGFSAGGYLGALAALDERVGPSGIKAIVAGAAPTDLSAYAQGDLMKRYFATDLEPFPEQLDEASPLNYVERGSPPVFMYYGREDDLVRQDHAFKFAEVLEKHEVPLELLWLPTKGHVTTFFSSGDAVDEAIDFLDRYLK